MEKCIVLFITAHWAKVICGKKSLTHSLPLSETLDVAQIWHTLNPSKQTDPSCDCNMTVVFLHFVQNTFNCVGKVV